MNLSLDEAVKLEVSDAYKRCLKKDGSRIIISTPVIHVSGGLKFLTNKSMSSVLLPLDPATIASLKEIEEFVKENVDSPRYKPLWLKDSMFVSVSKWCRYELLTSNGSVQQNPENLILGAGLYMLDIQASHVYIGPHKNGETFSLSLHVTRIAYEPEQSINELMNEIIQSLETPATNDATAAPPVEKKKKQRKRKNAEGTQPAVSEKKTTSHS